MEVSSKIIGQRLKQLRKSLDKTQEELAEESDLAVHVVRRLESGLNVGVDYFYILINFYSNIFSLETILSEEFFIIKKDASQLKIAVKHHVLKEKLELIIKDMKSIKKSIK